MSKLLNAEWYKFVHDKVYWALLAVIVLVNWIMLFGSRKFNLPGRDILSPIMDKEIITIMIASVYGGLFVGKDFEERTLYHGIMAGKGRARTLLAKVVVFLVAMNGLLLMFPLLAVLYCTIKNGWGISFTTGMALNLFDVFIALILLGCAIGMISLLVAVCFRDIGRTIGIPIILFLAMIPLLNSRYAFQLSHFLPVGTMRLVTNSTVSPVFGMLLGVVWSAVFIIISLFVFRKAELH